MDIFWHLSLQVVVCIHYTCPFRYLRARQMSQICCKSSIDGGLILTNLVKIPKETNAALTSKTAPKRHVNQWLARKELENVWQSSSILWGSWLWDSEKKQTSRFILEMPTSHRMKSETGVDVGRRICRHPTKWGVSRLIIVGRSLVKTRGEDIDS